MLFLLHKICYTDSKPGREIVPMKRVLITGGSGFLGARILQQGLGDAMPSEKETAK